MLEANIEGIRVKVIEKNKQRAEEIATELSSSIVLMVMHLMMRYLKKQI